MAARGLLLCFHKKKKKIIHIKGTELKNEYIVEFDFKTLYA